jgi:hypothetical protein
VTGGRGRGLGRGLGRSREVGRDPGAGPGREVSPGREFGRSSGLGRGRGLAAVALLTAITIAWAALPVAGAKAGIRVALVVAVICAAASLADLAIGDTVIGGDAFDPLVVRLAAQAAHIVRTLPWSEVMIIAILILEALHQSRPWHTAVLGVALLAYLFAAHLAETAARPGLLGPQLPVIAAGLGLLALAVGAAALPPLHAGPAAEVLRVLATIAAVLAGALALPTGNRTDPPRF